MPPLPKTGSSVAKQKIISMVKAYRDNCRQLSTAGLQKRFHALKEETKTAWVSKQDLLSFFDANPAANSMRIYFAAHDAATAPVSIPEYDGQLTVIFVPAKAYFGEAGQLKIDDLLTDDGVPGANGFIPGQGLDDFPLCPPTCPEGDNLEADV